MSKSKKTLSPEDFKLEKIIWKLTEMSLAIPTMLGEIEKPDPLKFERSLQDLKSQCSQLKSADLSEMGKLRLKSCIASADLLLAFEKTQEANKEEFDFVKNKQHLKDSMLAPNYTISVFMSLLIPMHKKQEEIYCNIVQMLVAFADRIVHKLKEMEEKGYRIIGSLSKKEEHHVNLLSEIDNLKMKSITALDKLSISSGDIGKADSEVRYCNETTKKQEVALMEILETLDLDDDLQSFIRMPERVKTFDEAQEVARHVTKPMNQLMEIHGKSEDFRKITRSCLSVIPMMQENIRCYTKDHIQSDKTFMSGMVYSLAGKFCEDEELQYKMFSKSCKNWANYAGPTCEFDSDFKRMFFNSLESNYISMWRYKYRTYRNSKSEDNLKSLRKVATHRMAAGKLQLKYCEEIQKDPVFTLVDMATCLYWALDKKEEALEYARAAGNKSAERFNWSEEKKASMTAQIIKLMTTSKIE